MSPLPTVEPATVPVSVIVPTFNEERFVGQCLSTLATQDYPHHHLEIIVVDGMSTDATCAVVESYMRRHPNIQLVRNPSGSTASAMNIGIRLARGDVIVRMDAHAEADRAHISTVVQYLLTTDFDMVGCLAETVGGGYWGQRIAIALSSHVGVGNARFRVAKSDVLGEPGWLGAFWKQTLLDIGCYDEAFQCNEDDELSYRMLYRGYTLYVPADLSVKYFCRTTLGGLWEQYYKFGFWKVALISKCRRVPAIRHIVPALFLLSVAGLALGALFSSTVIASLVVVLAAYGAFVAFGSWKGSRKKPIGWFATVAPVFLILHTAYGLGFLHGLFSPFTRQAADGHKAKAFAQTP